MDEERLADDLEENFLPVHSGSCVTDDRVHDTGQKVKEK